MLIDVFDRLEKKPLPTSTIDALAHESRTPLLIYLDAIQDGTSDVVEIARCVAAHLATWIYHLPWEFTEKYNDSWGLDHHNWRNVREQAYGEMRTEIYYVLLYQFGLLGAGPPADMVLPRVVFGRYRINREEVATLANALTAYRHKMRQDFREEHSRELTEGQRLDFDNVEKLINTLSHVRMEAARAEIKNNERRKTT